MKRALGLLTLTAVLAVILFAQVFLNGHVGRIPGVVGTPAPTPNLVPGYGQP